MHSSPQVGVPAQPAHGLLGRVPARVPEVPVRAGRDLRQEGQVVQLR